MENNRSGARVTLLLAASLLAVASAHAATLVVNDSSDTLHGIGCAVIGTGTCSLRDAITFANANAGPDEIGFLISGAGVQTITLASTLPSITGPVTIDGYTQPGSSANTNGFGFPDNSVHLIEINGNGMGCFLLENGSHTLRGLVVNRCVGPAIVFGGAPATQDVIEGNFLGTDSTGMISLGTGAGEIRADEFSGATQIRIGGEDPAARNVIGGVVVNSFCNAVAGNFIGTNAAGDAPIGNGGGVLVVDSFAAQGCSPSTLISRNLISGNGAGIFNGQLGFFRAVGNFIGTDRTGSVAIPNGTGISVDGEAIIGGLNPGDGNVISGNLGAGITHTSPSQSVFIEGNLIGTDATGIGPLGNGSTGILDSEGAITVIGNVIAFNGGGGVVITQQSLVIGGVVQGNSIFANANGLGIDLEADGPTPNDGCDSDLGANNRQNFPSLSSASSAAGTIVQGTLNSTPNTAFRLEFFANDLCDVSGYGQGQTFLGSHDVSTDGSCSATFEVTLASASTGQYITATATDILSGVTSEFSTCQVVVAAPPATVVIDTCDSGVPNAILPDGSTITDHILQCAAAARNHGAFVSCVSHLTNELKKQGIITGAEKEAIQRCAAQAQIP